MPPWPPNPDYHPLANERLLSEEEIQTIRNWVDAGSPPGDLSQAPAAPSDNSLEEISHPDLVSQLPTYTSKPLRAMNIAALYSLQTYLMIASSPD